MNLDPTLRDTLQSYADDAPAGAGLLDGALGRARHRRRARRVAAGGMAAVALAAMAIAGSVMVTGEQHPPAPADSAQTVAPASFAQPVFPYTPSWVPDRLARPVLQVSEGDHVYLSHYAPGSSQVRMSVTVSSTEPRARGDGARQEALVNGHRGVLVTQRGMATVTWQDSEGRWVSVQGVTNQGGSVDDVLRYADRLVEEPQPVPAPFTVDLLPAGAELVALTESRMEFRTPWGEDLVASVDRSGEQAWLRDAIFHGDFDEVPEPDFTATEVSGRPATTQTLRGQNRQRSYVVVDFPEAGWELTVASGLDLPDLVRIVETIDLTPTARLPRSHD